DRTGASAPSGYGRSGRMNMTPLGRLGGRLGPGRLAATAAAMVRLVRSLPGHERAGEPGDESRVLQRNETGKERSARGQQGPVADEVGYTVDDGGFWGRGLAPQGQCERAQPRRRRGD